jgi:hypothetical protein
MRVLISTLIDSNFSIVKKSAVTQGMPKDTQALNHMSTHSVYFHLALFPFLFFELRVVAMLFNSVNEVHEK